MIRKIFTLLMLVLASCFAFANGPDRSLLSNVPSDDCNWPAPLNFHVEDYGGTWVKLAWNPISPGLVNHRVKTYKIDPNGNVLLSNVVVPAAFDFVVVSNLPNGEPCFSIINAICEDGTDSKDAVTVIHPNRGFITELIVTGFDPSNVAPSCTLQAANQYCDFYTTQGFQTVFEFRNSYHPLSRTQFLTYKIPSGANNSLRAQIPSNSGAYTFKIDYQVPINYGQPYQGDHFQVFLPNSTTMLASFKMYFNYGSGQEVGRLFCESIAPGYEIVRRSAGPGETLVPNIIREDTPPNNEKSNLLASLSASPNPFSESLELTMDPNIQDPVHVQLLNLSGQVVLDRRGISGVAVFSLPTEQLAPGFYMLRAEAGGETKTIKVVKAD